MSIFNLRRRRLLSAVRLYQKGRNHVVWLHGVLYGGGSLFVLYNAVDYLIEPQARPTPIEISSLLIALLVSVLLGYLYGRATWRGLQRLFANRDASSIYPVQ